MTIEVSKLLTGGALPFVNYLPYQGGATGATAALAAGASAASAEGNLTLKDLFKLIGEIKGLPSDTGALVESLQDLFTENTLFSSGQLNNSNLVTTYLSALQKIKTAEYNKLQFETAQKTVTSNGGLHEYAIDEHGKLIAQNVDTGELKKISLKELYELGADGKYSPLTNSNLLYYRAEHPDFAFDNGVLTTVSNGIGLEKVTEMLQKALSGIGSSSMTEEGYTALQAGQITRGLNILLNLINDGNSPEDIWGDNGLLSLLGIYKTKYMGLDLKLLIMQAAQYLWKSMPKNARTWLELKSGNMENPEEGAKDMMMTLLFAHNTTKSDFSADYQKDLDLINGRIKKKSSGGSDDDKVNHYISMQNKIHGTYGKFELNSGTNNSLMVEGTKYGSIPDFLGKPMGTTSASKMLEGGLSGIVEDMHGISFGDHVLDPNDLANIWYDGSGGMMVDLPCKIVNGSKVVDLSVLDDYNKAYDAFKLLPKDQQTNEVFGKLLSEAGLDELLDDNGLPNKLRFDLFLVVTGYGVDKENKFWQNSYGEQNKYLEEIDTNNEALIKLIQADLSTDSKKSNYTIDTESWFESSSPDGFFLFDHVYKGTMYIPISNNEGQGHNAAGQKLGYDVMHEDEYRYLLELKRRSAKTASASLLNE